MKRYVLVATFLILTVWGALMLAACGGGGGGGGSSSGSVNLTPANIDQGSAEAAVNMAMVANEVSDGLTSIANSFVGMSAASSASLNAPTMVAPILMMIERQFDAYQTNGSLGPGTDQCSTSGSISYSMSWNGPDNPQGCSQMSNLRGSFTLNNCGEFYPFTINGRCSFTISGPLCNPTGISITYTNYSIASQTQTDSFSAGSFSVNVNNIQWSGSLATHQSLVLNGDIAGFINGRNFDAAFSNYTTTVSTSDDFNYSISISGSLMGGCLSGWVTVQTISPILVSDAQICPTAGEVVLSGNGSMNVVYYSDGSMDIGPVHYPSCEDVSVDCL